MTDKNNKENSRRFIINITVKGLLLFLALNFFIALLPDNKIFGHISLYNFLFPGRVRLPFGENPEEAYNLSIYDLEAMFSTHEIDAKPKLADEYRIILVGDSATWGILLEPQDTLSGLINLDKLTAGDGREVRAYNLAYPTLSLTKDLMILESALAYDPDLILWPVTLESFPKIVQVETPLVANNPRRAKPLIEWFNLNLEGQLDDFVEPTFWDKTLIGQRRAILDKFQLQMYGVLWAATGIDQTYPDAYEPAQRDFDENDFTFQNFSPDTLTIDQLAMDVIDASAELAGDVPVLVINEPILISQGENSDVRYNFFYPRWAYDQYRTYMEEISSSAEWHYLDLWDNVPPDAFTNSAVHLTPEGSELYYQALRPILESMIGP